ncbi:MAG: hypothetical protein L0Z62_16340 [Gemmataceae bacterium]|nr:hypothetical protein [Gemmataceae bacterium]
MAALDAVTEELRLPSLLQTPPRVQGHAYRFMIVLPLLSETGEVVFTDDHLRALHELLGRRCGGSLASSSLTHPAWHGSYRPDPEAESVSVTDSHTIFYVYTRQTDAADRFFGLLKAALKKAGGQDEILIERAPVWLVEAIPARG